MMIYTNLKCRGCTQMMLAVVLAMFTLQMSGQTVPGSYSTSWLGNTVGTETDHIMQDISQLFVGPDGYVAAITNWDEGGHNVMGFDTNGILKCDPQDCGTGSWGRGSGEAITYDGTYIYQVMSQEPDGSFDNIHYPSSGKWNTVARYTATGGNNSYAGFTNGKGHALHSILLNTDGAEARGLVTYNNELFVAVGNQMLVYQLPLASQSSNRSWTISDPGQLQVDASGFIWMFQPTNKKLIRYSNNGELQTQSITLASYEPRGFGIDKTNNKIYITNSNADQNILIYSNITTTPSLSGTFGTTGGILSGSGSTIGTVGPLRFNVPVGVGVDNNGNIYVACSGSTAGGGGAVIEKYNSSGTRLWLKYGLEFIDNAELAPSSETDAYTKEEHFTLNYGNTAVGTEQTYKGYTLNRFKYPQDARLHHAFGGVWVREFNGKRFLFITDMFSDALAIYRFNAATDGETAIPCGFISKKYIDGTWPANQPASEAWIWTDANGNGNFDSGEYTTYSSGFSSWGWNIDHNGAVWIVSDGADRAVYQFPCQGLDGNGSPMYNFTTMVTSTGPSIFTEMQRLEYDAANDQMYIGGYTSNYPHEGSAWGRLGREVARVDNWSTGNRNPNMRIAPLPNDQNGDAAIKDISVAGDFVFALSCFYGDITVYDKSSGGKVGMITPQDIGRVGWADMPASIRAYKLSNGEYIIFTEEDGFIKVLMYRWSAGNYTPIYATDVTMNPTSASLAVNETTQLTGTVAPSNASNQSVSWSSLNASIATVNAKGLVTGVSAGSTVIVVTSGEGGKTDSCKVTVTSPLSGLSGNVTAEFWFDIVGTEITDIPLTEGDTTSILTSIEIPSNAMDYYLTRVRGYIIPSKTGSYNFYIASDDDGQLWLSTNNLPENKILIASVSGWTDSRQWAKFPSQKSADISLTAGTRYYFEALMKEGDGGDNLAVAWKGADINDITVISGANLDKYVEGQNVAVTSVTLNPGFESLKVNEGIQLFANVLPSSAQNQSVTWSSSDSNIAMVSSTGMVTAKATGAATITVTTADGSKTDSCVVTVVNTVGISDNTLNNLVSIYPNPATDIVTIDFGNSINKQYARVQIVDLYGKEVYQSGIVPQMSAFQLNTSQFAKGIYVVNITIGTEKVCKKLVIQ